MRRVLWVRVAEGVSRGYRDGRSVGELHTVRAGVVAVDPTGTPVGRYPTADEARRALRSVIKPVAREASPHTERAPRALVSRTAATVLGGVALAGALTAAAAAPWL